MSIVSLKDCYITQGIILYNNGHGIDKDGLVFTYISHNLNYLSIIKSRPNT